MKRIAIVLAVLLVVPFMAGSASAAEKGIRRYVAQTSEGQVLRFRTARDEGVRRLSTVFFGEGFELACDDGTSASWGGARWRFFAGNRFEGRSVTLDVRFDTFAFHIQGTFGPARASGTFRYTAVFLNKDETTRVCTTGDPTWTAERVV